MNNIDKIKAMHVVFEDIVKSKEMTYLIEKYSKLDKLPKFIFAGVGKNWYICEKVVKTFISMGIHAEALDCTHALHGDLGILSNVNYIDEEKIIFFISKSGTTAELIKLAKVVKALKLNNKIKNTYTISFNLNTERPFAELFDLSISPSKKFANMPMYEFDKRNLVPTLSINVMQMVLDLFGNELYESKPELVENYVYNHLGGSNGEKLGGNKILDCV